MNGKNILYVVAGPSGSGKTTLVELLRKKYGLVQAESYTDRPKRSGNETGHHFVTEAEYDLLEEKILETVFDGHRYAMTIQMLDQSDLIVLDIPGIMELRQSYTGRKICVIGIDCPVSVLIKRMHARKDRAGDILRRLRHDRKSFAGMGNPGICDVVISNTGSTEELEKKALQVMEQHDGTAANRNPAKMPFSI